MSATPIRIEKRRLRDVMPYCDGNANPWQWVVFRGDEMAGGPFSTAREAWAFADIAADRELAEWRRKRRETWLSRPLNEREQVILENFSLAVRGHEANSEFKRDDVADWLIDHFRGEGEGHAAFLELIRAVEEEQPKEAIAALERAMRVCAKVTHELEL